MSELMVEVRRMNLADLKPAEYNPRRMSDEAFEGLGHSISRFGMLAHIVWNKRSGNIVGGHQRYKHLVEMGEKETDVVVVDLDDNEEVALNITLNNPSTRGVFTKSVVGHLEQTEKVLKAEFEKIGLGDMLNYLSRYKFDGPEEPRGGGGKSGGEGKKDGMRCPRCRSVWRVVDGEVIRRSGVSNG